MKLSELIETKQVRTIFGKPTGKYVAKIIGTSFEGQGFHNGTALTSLVDKLKAFDRWGYYRRYWHTASGETLCLFRTFDGWQYDITRPGQDVPGTCMLSCQTQADAVAAVESHVAQYNQDAKLSVQSV